MLWDGDVVGEQVLSVGDAVGEKVFTGDEELIGEADTATGVEVGMFVMTETTEGEKVDTEAEVGETVLEVGDALGEVEDGEIEGNPDGRADTGRLVAGMAVEGTADAAFVGTPVKGGLVGVAGAIVDGIASKYTQ